MNTSLYHGAMLIVLSELFLVCSGMIVKQVTGQLPTEIIVFARNIFGLALLLPWLFRNGFIAIKTEHLRFHFMRAFIGVSAMMCLYYSWGHLPLAEAAMIKQTAPFFIPVFAFFWLGERINIFVKLALIVGFAGVYLILNPAGEFKGAVFIALVGAMLSGLVRVVIRRMSSTESPQRIVFYFALFSSLLSLIPALLNWVTPDIEQLGWLLMMAITSTIAQLLLSKGYRYAPAGQLGPFTFASVFFATLFGWLIWDEILGLNSWLGLTMILGAGMLSLTGNTKKKQR